MVNTRFELDSDQEKLKATGYSNPLPGTTDLRVAPYAPLRGIASAGQLHSNVEDLAKWMSFQFSSGRKTHPSNVLSAATLAEMHRPVYMSHDWTSGQAIGWRMNRRGGLVLHEHGGGIQGFSSSMVFSTSAQTGVIVLANMWPAASPYAIAENLAELVISELGPIEDRIGPALANVSQDRSAPYVGRYWAEPGFYLDIVYDDAESGFGLGAPDRGDNSLHGPAELKIDSTIADPHAFRVEGGRGAGELVEFSLGEAGQAASFRLGGFLYRRVD